MIVAIVSLCYGVIPFIGAIAKRGNWRKFRRRFDELRLKPVLDYSAYRHLGGEGVGEGTVGGVFRFTGGFESITDGKTLWIQGDDLTIPVFLGDDQTWLLPIKEGAESFDPGEEMPERIRWERVSTLTEGARVFVGGSLVFKDERWNFVSTRGRPLMVVFYDGPDSLLATRAIRAGRQRNEYWNAITPYSLVVGAGLLLLIAFNFLNRPAYRLTVITAFVSLFIPLFPLIPPGLLFTAAFRSLSWRACVFRAYRDLARLPLSHFAKDCAPADGGNPPNGNMVNGENVYRCGQLPGGEWYGCIRRDSLPPEARNGKIPFLLPEYAKERKNSDWYIFGAFRKPAAPEQNGESPEDSAEENPAGIDGLPVLPKDPAAIFGIIHGKPETLARRYAVAAYTLETIAWVLQLAGIGLNLFFLGMILLLI